MWRANRQTVTTDEIAAGTGMGFAQAMAQRDALVAAGELEQVRVGALSGLAYRPAAHLRNAPAAAVQSQKAEPPEQPSVGLRALRAKIGYRPR